MKKLYFTVVFAFMAIAVQAQVDRSIMPKPGPSPEINLDDPQRFELKNGLKVLVVENHKLPRVSIQLTIDNPPIVEGDKSGVSSLTGSLMGNGSTSIDKDAFNEEVDFLGANISFGSQSGFASSLSKYFPRIIELMADAAINPNFTQEEFEKEKEKLLTGLKSQEKDVSSISSRVQSALAYGTDHPYGEFTTEATVNNVSLADTKQFYTSYFVPANAYLVIIGDVNFKEVQKLVKKHFTPWTKAVPPSFSFSKPSDVQYTQVSFVDVPNAVQSEITVQNLVDLKMKDADYLPALVANQILGGGGEARLFLNLREDKGYTYGSYSRLGNSKHSSSRFRATASVRNAVTDSSVVELLKEIDRISKEPVTAKELKNTKAKYIGNFVLALERPSTIANYALNIETEGLPKDFYKTYLERINAITIEDVQNASKKYFNSANARVVVAGKGSDVLENLEKVSFNGKKVPIKYFDKYAAPTEKPKYDMEIPEGTTAQKVLEKYIMAIGGKEKLGGVNSYLLVAEAEIQGTKLELNMKRTSKNQMMQDVKVMGNSMSKQVLDGDTGYKVIQGQRSDLTDEEKALMKEQSFYAVESGLKVREINTVKAQGQEVTSTITYGDYKEVSGIQFPFLLSQSIGPQTFDFIVKEIKVNEDVSDVDFK